MIKLNTPTSPDVVTPTALGGNLYQFHYQYNGSTPENKRWYLDIYLGKKLLIAGLKLIDGFPLLSKYSLVDFNHGELYVIKFKETDSVVGRDNLGIGKEYSLVYISNDEIEGDFNE